MNSVPQKSLPSFRFPATSDVSLDGAAPHVSSAPRDSRTSELFATTHESISQDPIYHPCQLSAKLTLPITVVATSNLRDVITREMIKRYEGKCSVEGFVKPNSVKVTDYSNGVLRGGDKVLFEVKFEFMACFPVEGQHITCVVKEISKAGIRAEVDMVPSPVTVYVCEEQSARPALFRGIRPGSRIVVSVFGQRFELNDRSVQVMGKLVSSAGGQSKKNAAPPPRAR